MNAEELIEELKKVPPKTMVVISGYEGGLNEVSTVEAVKIRLNVNDAWYYGKHEHAVFGDTDTHNSVYVG